MWIKRRCAEGLLLALAGCSADDGLGGSSDGLPDGGPTPDAIVCSPGEVPGLEGCVPVPPDRCIYLDQVAAGCVDADGDCHVAAPCSGPPAWLLDCQDDRPDVHPEQPEACDGLDNDCDGAVDEDFPVGQGCAVCGRAGKQECSAVDPRAVACSTALGQSEAAPPVPEVCANQQDDDCDEATDEGPCRLDRPVVERTELAVAGSALLLIEAGALVRLDPVAGTSEVLDAGPARWVSGDEHLVAWVKPDPERPCEAPPGGPIRCPAARLFVQPVGESTRDLTGLADLGPPWVHEGAVYWHTVLGDGPVLQRWTLAGGREALFAGEAVSDPGGLAASRIAVRVWEGGRPRVAVRGLDGVRDVRIEGPAPLGRPALSGEWVAWVAEGPALWVVPLEQPRGGFQLTAGTRPLDPPWLLPDRGLAGLFWLDEAGLRQFQAGREALVVPGLTDPARVVVRPDGLWWLAEDGIHQGLAP